MGERTIIPLIDQRTAGLPIPGVSATQAPGSDLSELLPGPSRTLNLQGELSLA